MALRITPETIDTIEAFTAFVALPENADKLFEYIDGEVKEVSPGRTLYSEVGHAIAFAVRLFCRDSQIPCHTSGEGGAYIIKGQVLAPDFAYKRTPMSDAYPDPVAPEWAVEIISPTDKAGDIRRKRQIHQDAGILYWEIYLQAKTIDVYPPGKTAQTVGIDEILNGGDVLPGFRLPVHDVFVE